MIRSRTAIVALLTWLNFLNYLDRFLVAAVLPRILEPVEHGGLGLSNTEGGALATVFLAGFFLTAPVFGRLGDRRPRKRLIAAGVATWSLATVGSGLAPSLWVLILARALVGVGEASYATLAPTIIDDITPPASKARALAIFYLAVPIGSACGYLVGGLLQAAWGWRATFLVAGGPGIALALLCLAIAEPHRGERARDPSAAEALSQLTRLPLYRRAVLGYCAHTAAIGAFAYWGPKFLSERFADALAPARWTDLADRARQILGAANLWFGTVTVVAGALGTLIGGRLADRAVARLPAVPDGIAHDDPRSRRIANAQLRVCALGVALATPLAVAAFVAPSPPGFFACAGLAEIGLFMATAPINAILLRTVPAYLRASAMAIAIFAIHLLGDLWSPPLIGLLLDHLAATAALMAVPAGFAIATAVWWPRAREAGEA